MSNELRGWLSKELEKRHWSQRELSRQSGVSQTLVSQTLSGDIAPSADFCIKVAIALGELPERVLRRAGILPTPTTSEDDPTVAAINDIVRNLPPEMRRQLLDFAQFLYRRSKEKE